MEWKLINLNFYIRYLEPSTSSTSHQQESNDLDCVFCHKSFNTKTQLKQHLMHSHNNERNFACEICQKTFKTPQDVKIHRVVHSDLKKYKCQLCEKEFKRTTNLKEHLLTHSDERKYQCELCPKRSKAKNNLKKHMWGPVRRWSPSMEGVAFPLIMLRMTVQNKRCYVF